MKNDVSKKKKELIRSVRAVLTGALAGSAAAMILLLVCVYAVVKMQSIPYGAITPLSVVMTCLGAFIGGYICGRISRRLGMVLGAACGGIMFLIFVGIGLAAGGIIGSVTLIRLALMAASGALGGIAGVNRRR